MIKRYILLACILWSGFGASQGVNVKAIEGSNVNNTLTTSLENKPRKTGKNNNGKMSGDKLQQNTFNDKRISTNQACAVMISGGSIGNSQQVCFNTVCHPFISLAGASGGTLGYAYQWQKSIDLLDWDDISGAVDSIYADTSHFSTTTYFRRKVNEIGCTVFAFSDTLTLKVLAQLNGGVIGNSQQSCDSLLLQPLSSIDSVTGGGGNYIYQWQVKSIGSDWANIPGAQADLYKGNQTLKETYQYRREVIDNQCGIAFSNMITAAVLKNVQIISQSQSVVLCEGLALDLSVELSDSTMSCQWFVNREPLQGETSRQLHISSLQPNQEGVYTLAVYGACTELQSKPIQVKVNLKSILNRKWDDVILVDNSSNLYQGYQWFKNNIKIPGADKQFYQEKGGLNGTYFVELLSKNGIWGLSCDTLIKLNTPHVQLYPVPVSKGEVVHVMFSPEVEISIQNPVSYGVYSMFGQQVMQGIMEDTSFDFLTKSLSKGMYLLYMKTSENKEFKEKIWIK